MPMVHFLRRVYWFSPLKHTLDVSLQAILDQSLICRLARPSWTHCDLLPWLVR
jgi:hypothetical protein